MNSSIQKNKLPLLNKKIQEKKNQVRYIYIYFVDNFFLFKYQEIYINQLSYKTLNY